MRNEVTFLQHLVEATEVPISMSKSTASSSLLQNSYHRWYCRQADKQVLDVPANVVLA